MKYAHKITIIMLSFIFFLLFPFEIKALPNKTFNDYGVCIDPGHGGYDGGARGLYDLVEKDLNLNISIFLANYLKQVGFDVILTRSSDIDLVTPGIGSKKKRDLDTRIEIINNSSCDFFVSIHMNSLNDERWKGAQTFYFDFYEENKRLAECIQESLIDTLQNTDRKAKSISNLYLFKMVKKPGVLIEAGFLSNPSEANLLRQPKYQDLVAFSIYLGILKCLS
ncbi:MAG TPA: N-acetylmuramoyl-L-alanine amidase [Haloplasmataceae bacterium]